MPIHLLTVNHYKVIYLDGFYSYLGYFGTPLALAIMGVILYLLRTRIEEYFLAIVPVTIFPIVIWGLYKIAFAAGGHEAGWDRGDFSTIQAEMELAHEIISVLSGGLVVALLSSLIIRLLFFRKGKELNYHEESVSSL